MLNEQTIASCLPAPLKCVKSADELDKVTEFRKQEYKTTYPTVKVAKNDPFFDHAYVVYSNSENGKIDSTGTVVFDSEEKGLPEDKYFPEMVSHYRRSGKKLMEVGRFVIEGRQVQILQRYYKAIYEIARKNDIDIVLMVIKQKDVRFHKRMIGVEVLVDDIDEGFGSGYAFSCIAWHIANTKSRFHKWVALV